MVLDLKNSNVDVPPCLIKGQTVERVNAYRYLGVIIDDKLVFSMNCDDVFKKCRQRMHILYTLRAFKVNSVIIDRCYHAFILSVLSYALVCWFGLVNEKERRRLNGIVRMCGKIAGRNQQSLEDIYTRRTLEKARKIINDQSHVLNTLFEVLPSGQRLRQIKCRTNRYRNSFIPQAITLLNKHYKRSSREICS